MKNIVLIFIFILTATLDALAIEANNTNTNGNTSEYLISQKIDFLNKSLEDIDKKLKTENIWLKKYSSYYTYKQLKSELEAAQDEIKSLEKIRKRNDREEQSLEFLKKRVDTLGSQLALLKEFEMNPFGDLMMIEEIQKAPEVENPLAVISAYSFIKQLQHKKESLEDSRHELSSVIKLLGEKESVLKEIIALKSDERLKEELSYNNNALDDLKRALNIFETTMSVYNKKADEVILNLSEKIKSEGKKSFIIGIVILILFTISFVIKFGTRRYIHDNERLYTSNKIVNFANFGLIALILLFSYIENVSYMVTILGFASAGLAIAMKDLFMSVLGWIVIIIGGSIHVGDRLKVEKDGSTFVGDVLDISLLRITIYEDVTLTTYLQNRRAGRIIFIPNNYIFTNLIANYTHADMKTVWDGIDFTVTFDSNFKKAMNITKDVVKKYSKGYTEITRKQLNSLRDKYSVRNSGVEPRVFSFIEANGMRISAWYLTNSYAILTLRSTISAEIIEEILKENDIHIAYPITEIKYNAPINQSPQNIVTE